MPDAIRAATEGRFLLQGGPLALLLAQQVEPFGGLLGQADDALRAGLEMQQVRHAAASAGAMNSSATASGQEGNQAWK
jgi:hypothetical protein